MSGATILILVMMVATALVLLAGIIVMARGGEVNAKYSNKLMSLRVILQGATLLLLGLLFMASR